jgi:hypothetical protein
MVTCTRAGASGWEVTGEDEDAEGALADAEWFTPALIAGPAHTGRSPTRTPRGPGPARFAVLAVAPAAGALGALLAGTGSAAAATPAAGQETGAGFHGVIGATLGRAECTAYTGTDFCACVGG